jgi:hypothetical protein
VGNNGKKLLFRASTSATTATFLYPNIVSNEASSSYQSLQIQDQGQLADGVELIASYTWAHAIDNSSDDSGGNFPVRGNSTNDIRNAASVALNYSLPRARNGLLWRSVSSGWLFSTRFTAQSGYAFDANQGTYTLPSTAQALIRPNVVPGKPLYLHNVANAPGGWEINQAALSLVPLDPNTGAPLVLGDLGRNYLHGPPFWVLSSALQRTFHLRDALAMDFRVDAFNSFNHPTFGDIDANLYDATFGQALNNVFIGVPNSLYSTGGPRSLQLMLKLKF